MGRFICGFITGVASLVGLAILSDKIETKKAKSRIDAKDDDASKKRGMHLGFTFEELGLDEVKDIDKEYLYKAYEDRETYYKYLKELRDCRFAVNAKELLSRIIIETAKAMIDAEANSGGDSEAPKTESV